MTVPTPESVHDGSTFNYTDVQHKDHDYMRRTYGWQRVLVVIQLRRNEPL